MSPGEQIALWSVRLSMLAYVATLALRLRGRAMHVARWLWTMGLILLIAHTIAVFGVYHAWSHAAAIAHTARRTEELTGWNWGGGLYFNYAFLALWALDVLWWWLNPVSYIRRGWWIELLIQSYLALIVVNATIVFAAGPIRWISLGLLIVLAVLACRKFCVWRR